MKNLSYTHRVAVTAYVVKDDKFLLLKRNNEPCIWAPPGGRLEEDENPEEGLKREIKEETNFDIEIIAPVNTWFGEWQGKPLLSIDYLVRTVGGKLQLSDEHSSATWVSLEELKKGVPIELDPRLGFKLKDFQKAKRLIDILQEANYQI